MESMVTPVATRTSWVTWGHSVQAAGQAKPAGKALAIGLLALLAVAGCAEEKPARPPAEEALRAALLALGDAPPGFADPVVQILDPEGMTDTGLFRITLCQRGQDDLTPGSAPAWTRAASAAFADNPPRPVPATLDEVVVVYTDDEAALQQFRYFRDWLAFCEAERPEPGIGYETIALSAMGDETLAFAVRPQGRPDLHQVLIRARNVLIVLAYQDWPDTDIAVTTRLARRALTKVEHALFDRP